LTPPLVYCVAAFNTAGIQHQNTSVMGEPTVTQIGGASGGLAGALISKIQKLKMPQTTGVTHMRSSMPTPDLCGFLAPLTTSADSFACEFNDAHHAGKTS
jgi:hypothetical protein